MRTGVARALAIVTAAVVSMAAAGPARAVDVSADGDRALSLALPAAVRDSLRPGGGAYRSVATLEAELIGSARLSFGSPRLFAALDWQATRGAAWQTTAALGLGDLAVAPYWLAPVLVDGEPVEIASVTADGHLAAVGTSFGPQTLADVSSSAPDEMFVGADPLGIFRVDAAGRFHRVAPPVGDAPQTSISVAEFRAAYRDAVRPEPAIQSTPERPVGLLVGGLVVLLAVGAVTAGWSWRRRR